MFRLSDSIQQKLGYLAIFGLALSLMLHICSFIVIKRVLDWAAIPYILAVILIIPFSAMIHDLYTRKSTDDKGYSNPFSVFLFQLSSVQQAILVGILLYMAFNFIYTIKHLEGQSELLAAGYAVNNHGHLKAVTQQAFYKNRAFELRFLSGHLFVFYILPAFYFLAPDRRRQSIRAS